MSLADIVNEAENIAGLVNTIHEGIANGDPGGDAEAGSLHILTVLMYEHVEHLKTLYEEHKAAG